MLFNTSILENEDYTWLKKSSFYENINTEENEEIEFFICSSSTNDIKEFLEIGKIWIVNYYPPQFYDLLFNNTVKSIECLKELFLQTHYPFYNFLIV